ncbi:MAG: FAD-dependent oxidoreductase [Microbacteriaceae bacterium]|nr:FAD-dependent oxidoreductase [Microbacteriaceae bacterium]
MPETRDCVIAGGGPAGVVLGYLLAREGLRVTVLEKHADFLRDFRGDTIHPSTLTILGELGLRERFLELPVDRVDTFDAVIDGERLTLVDFGTLPPPDDFLVFAPQWDFLNFMVREGAKLPGFEVLMSTEATDLILDGTGEDARVVGLRAGDRQLRATLTVAADGRDSRIRDAAGLVPDEFGVAIDVLWFDLPKPPNPPPVTLAYLGESALVLTLDRGERYQAGAVIRKGGFEALRARGLEEFRSTLTGVAPVLAPVVGSIAEWSQVKLLSVQLNRLRRWHREGFIAIGDAAHAMSPVGGVGINYAIQDAVALAARVVPELRAGSVSERTLAAVQRRRLPPVRSMQRIQKFVHERIAGRAVQGRTVQGSAARDEGRGIVPAPVHAILRHAQPILQRIAARFIGLGIRPEHVARR